VERGARRAEPCVPEGPATPTGVPAGRNAEEAFASAAELVAAASALLQPHAPGVVARDVLVLMRDEFKALSNLLGEFRPAGAPRSPARPREPTPAPAMLSAA